MPSWMELLLKQAPKMDASLDALQVPTRAPYVTWHDCRFT